MQITTLIAFLVLLTRTSGLKTHRSFSFTFGLKMSASDLDTRLRTLEPSSERSAFDLQQVGRGGANHKADIRLFDAPDDYEPEVTFYRDQAAWCPYCEKVWLQLEEKRIPYKVVKVPLSCYGDKPAFFRSVNPSGSLPVATIKGRTLSESNDIMNLLEYEFPDNKPLYPTSEADKQKVAQMLRLERELFGVWFQWLRSPSFPGLNMQEKEMDKVLRKVDADLQKTDSEGPYFLGKELSIVDIMYTPFLERMAASLPYFKGFESRSGKYPYLMKWYEAMDTRHTYQGIKSDYFTHNHDLPPQIGGAVPSGNYKPYMSEIDGGAWTLDKRQEDLIEPMLPADSNIAIRDAVRKCLSNYENLVKFACRGMGKAGSPKVRAELADPYATSDLDYFEYVDGSLNTILTNMLNTVEGIEKVAGPVYEDKRVATGVKACLLYLRERGGVPRDMTVHGARQLRAFINDYINNDLSKYM